MKTSPLREEEERRTRDFLDSSPHTQNWVRRKAMGRVTNSEIEAELVDWRFLRKRWERTLVEG